MSKLLGSKYFWTALVDALIGIVFLVVGEFKPDSLEFLKSLWLYLQPLVAMVLAILFGEDVKALAVLNGFRFRK